LKVLLDENLPHKLRHSLTGHDVRTVDYMGWSGEKNGEQLKFGLPAHVAHALDQSPNPMLSAA
jgi:hypothetical protein